MTTFGNLKLKLTPGPQAKDRGQKQRLQGGRAGEHAVSPEPLPQSASLQRETIDLTSFISVLPCFSSRGDREEQADF